jgi:putative phosphoribosyl transferase
MRDVQKYVNRWEAAEIITEELKPIVNGDVVVLSLPKGGVVIGAEVAKALKVEHDLVVCRKIGAPYNPEVAIGALTQDGRLLKDDSVIDALAVTKGYIESQTKRELKEIKRQLREYRNGKSFPSLINKTVILIDDGLATGFTMEAALKFVKTLSPSRIIVAVPVGSMGAIRKISQIADEVICPLIPKNFWAVGQFYYEFEPVSDGEVKKLFKEYGEA